MTGRVNKQVRNLNLSNVHVAMIGALSGNVVGHINNVTLCQSWLVLGWVTVGG